MEILDFPYPGRWGRRWAWLALAAGSALTGAGCVGRTATPAIDPVEQVRASSLRPVEPPNATIVPVPTGHHTVLPGETLWRIARTYGVDLGALARANAIADPSLLQAGRVLAIPGTSVDVANWVWPVSGGKLLSGFGAQRKRHRHRGIDIRGAAGQHVLAARAGHVKYSGSGMGAYGKTVILDHGDGITSLYAHNARLLVRVGERVDRGQPIARVGRSGNATTEHCHFEIRRDERPFDPLLLLPAERGTR